jgi:NADH:ubiquinone oxidoreductase subunit 5 (subunit L)/multisubunit Na+/H+ antiporter MnhA subunit
MGFMILTCGLGLWAAAVIHLVAHGFYKATLFLSSGSAISRHRRHEALPPTAPPAGRQRLARAVAAVVLPGLALGAAVAVVPSSGGDHAAEQALLIFAWATGAAAMWGWLQRCTGAAGAIGGTAVLAAAAVGYVAIVNALSGFLAPALPPSGLSATSVWLLAAAALALLGGLAVLRRSPAAGRLQQTLYTGALSAGHISPVLTTGGRS